MKRAHVRLLFEPRDLWVGIYWDWPFWEGHQRNMHIYVCLIPMLPLRITLTLRSLV